MVPVKSTKRNPGLRKQRNQTQEGRNRFGFNLEKDLNLLRATLQFNPWQLGSEKWAEISEDLKSKHEYNVTGRTVKERVALLVKKFKSEELCSKTGTEEARTERGSLIESLIALIEESEARINVEHGPDTDRLSDDDIALDDTVDYDASSVLTVTIDELNTVGVDLPVELNKTTSPLQPASESPENKKSKLSASAQEKKRADDERDLALGSIRKELAPGPSGVRSRRFKMAPEDEFIQTKQEHEIKMELLRFNAEQKNKETSFQLESSKLELEKSRIVLEGKNQERLADESKRKDEIAMSQIQFQNSMCQFMMTFTKK